MSGELLLSIFGNNMIKHSKGLNIKNDAMTESSVVGWMLCFYRINFIFVNI